VLYNDRPLTDTVYSNVYNGSAVSCTAVCDGKASLDCHGRESVMEGDSLTIDWTGFEQWLRSKGLCGSYVRKLVLSAKRFGEGFFSGRLKDLGELKHNELASLANRSKWLGVYRQFKELKENYGLRWHQESSESVFSLICGQEIDGVEEWLRVS